MFDVYIYQTDYITKHMIKTNNSSTWELDYTNYTNPIETTSTTFDGDVWLLAGGGTIPVTISIGDNGPNYSLKNVFNQAWGQEPKITDKYIVNTSKDKEGSYGNLHCNINKAVKLNDSPLAITSVADVHIEVLYGTQFYELVAYKGVAPHKIRVPLGTQWLLEREEIIKGYPRFDRYVKYQDADGNSLTEGPGATTDEEGNQIGDGKEYTHDERANSVWNTYNLSSLYVLPEDFVYTPRHQETSWSGDEEFIREEIISNGSSGSGYHNGEPVLIRRRH